MAAPSDADTVELQEAPTSKKDLLVEVGATGTTFTDGSISSPEFNTKLTGPTGAAMWDKMRRTDAAVKASLRVQTLPLHGATWFIECEDEQIQSDLEEALFVRTNWTALLRHLLLCLPFGFEVLEIVWMIEDGKMWPRKFGHRAQGTILKWNVDENGDLREVVQSVERKNGPEEVAIPVEKILHLAVEQEGNNFEGISGLRSAYKHWMFKEIVERVDVMEIERFGLGIPYAIEPEGGTNPTAKATVRLLLKNMRSGAKSYYIQPYGWEIGIQGHGTDKKVDTLPTLRYHGEQISLNSLAMFLNLGTTASGSKALASNFLDMFFNAEEAVAGMVVDGVQPFIDRFKRYNYANGDGIEAKLNYSDLVLKSVETISKAISLFSSAGLITPDDGTEDECRKLLDFPPKGQTSGNAGEESEEAEAEGSTEEDEIPEEEEEKAKFAALRRGNFRGPVHHTIRMSGKKVTVKFREKLPIEEFVALAEIEDKQDAVQDDIAQIFKTVKPAWIESLIEDLREGLREDSPSAIDRVQVPRSLRHSHAGEIVALMRETFRYGRQTIKDERKAQRVKATESPAARFWNGLSSRFSTLRDEPLDPEETTALFHVRARKFLDRLSRKTEAVATERALDLHRAAGTDFDAEDLEDIGDELLSLFDNTARMESRVLVSSSFSMGRMRQAEDYAKDIEVATYSAILDGNACETCAHSDKQEFKTSDSTYYSLAPPNQNCESGKNGANLCRCIYIYTFRSQSRARG